MIFADIRHKLRTYQHHSACTVLCCLELVCMY